MTARPDYVAGLRALAGRLEANPDCPLPYTGNSKYGAVQWVLDNREDVRAVARLLGTVTKERQKRDGGLKLTGRLGGVVIEVLTYGDVCERVEVGTTTETRQVECCPECEADVTTDEDGTVRCSAQPHYAARPPTLREVTVEVPQIVTRCPESLLKPEPETAA